LCTGFLNLGFRQRNATILRHVPPVLRRGIEQGVAAIGSYLQALRQFSRPVRLYLVSSALFGFTIFGGIYTLLLNLYLLRLGYGPDFVGVVNGAGMLALALFAIPAGSLGNRWGSRRALIVGLSLIVIGLALLPLAELVPVTFRGAWLVGTYMVAWLGVAMYFVNTNPFLMGVTTPVERAHVFSVQAALWPVAGFAGSFAGGILPGSLAGPLRVGLDHPALYRYPLLFAAVLLIPSVLAMRAARDAGRGEQPAVARVEGTAPYRPIVLLSLVTFLQLAGEGATRSFFNVYLDNALGIPTARIGILMGASQLLAVPAALATPLLALRLGNRDTVMAASYGMALSLLPVALVAHSAAAGLGLIGLTAMASIRRPAISVYGMEIVATPWRTAMSSATTMAVGLSWCLVAAGGGYLITNLGYRSFFLAAAGVTAAGAFLFWGTFRTLKAR
jgi:fucose permease